jgi:hypothetical protein
MSTNSRIGILNQDGSIESVYHHSDGYPEWLGVVLKKKFSSSIKVRDLMELGDISCIHTRNTWGEEVLEKPAIRTFNQRGEKTQAMEHEDLAEYVMFDPVAIEFSYLWNTDLNEWKCYKSTWDFDWNIPLTPETVEIPNESSFDFD